MKKARTTRLFACCIATLRILLVSVLFCCLATSCGLEDFIYIEPITSCGSPKLPGEAASSSNKSDWLFTFTPADNANSGDANYKGAEIVYRIYKSYTKCLSDYNAISSQNQNASTQANIYTYLVTTKKFARLHSIPNSANINSINVQIPLFPENAGNPNRTIRIRFITYNDIGDSSKASGIYITDLAGNAHWSGLPARDPEKVSSSITSKTFYDFIESPDSDTNSSDVDVTAKSVDADPSNYWYITAWALSYGVKTDYSPVYSRASYLGTIPLIKGDD